MVGDSTNSRSPLLPDRYPTADFFVCDLFDAAPKGDMASMAHPVFSLSTKPDHRIRRYESGPNYVEVKPGADGLATIHDRDVLIYCISQIMAGMNKGAIAEVGGRGGRRRILGDGSGHQEGYAMEEGTVVPLPRPGATLADDPLLAVLREGARRMLTQAVEAEVEAFLAAHAGLADGQGRRRLVRNGHAPERSIQTGIGSVEVRRPRVRDRGDGGSEPVRFSSAILPPYLRRTRNIEELLPWLYLKGVSTGRFAEALVALLGPDAPGLSATTVRRLTEAWQEEHARWRGRDLSARRYVYLWADGVHFTPRLDHERQCLLVLIGADAQGRKELLAVEDGFRESAQSWRELLLRLRDENGLALGPELATRKGNWARKDPDLPDKASRPKRSR